MYKINSTIHVNYLWKSFVLLFFFLFITILMPTRVHAADTEDPLGFSVEAVRPDTQIDQNKTFFFIKTEPGQPQELKVKVTGTGSESVKIKVYVANAVTSEEATIDYVAGKENNSTLVNSLEEITSIDQTEIEVAPEETKEVTLTVSPPAESYTGAKIGAVYFEKVTEEESTDAVNSQYAYRIGIIASGDGAVDYSRGQTLNLLSAEPELLRLQKTIGLTFENPESQVISDFSMKIEIVDKESGAVVKTQSMNKGSIAPNSQFTYPVDWGIDAIPSGTYIARVSAQSNLHEWELEQEFTISAEKAKEMNDETVFKLTLPSWFYILTILITIGTFGLTVYLVIRGKSWKKQRSAEIRKRKKNKKRPIKGGA
ncbi:DUF916 and DUF3324 domain-containing protein [Enterococcus sp. HY326]|uniref:DUF916 and DUF3324 domain-containing protein n=1 Tax=Enterococcus sp. HY326 TaxID=2971265 RepID=UPI00223F90AF|nr:DUF916 and DUF3324 domain-containing protein [Enterococcus sp. HY326]